MDTEEPELPASGSRPSLCVAYLLLSGTSGWALRQTPSSCKYALGTFSFLLGHSLLGFLHSTHPDPGNMVREIFKQTSMLSEIAPIALMNAEFYLLSGFEKEIALAHLATAILPMATQFLMKEHTRPVLEASILANLGSLMYLQFAKETGVWTAGLIALTGLNHFVFKQLCTRYDVPKIEVVTIGLSFFTIFAVNCLNDLSLLFPLM